MAQSFRLIAVAISIVFQISVPAFAQEPIVARALVYKGPGSCEEHCSESSADVAKLAGFEPVYVGPKDVDPAIFKNAAVWIQPGGVSSTVALNMDPVLKDNLREFIANGGGYVGFCAGGFFSTAMVGSTKNKGLGIMPGRSTLVKTTEQALMVDVTWAGLTRHLYFEGGPYFTFEKEDAVEITATYADGTVASARAAFGKGRVYVTGPHPEAPQYWRDYFKLEDRDGLDPDLARDMVLWAAGRPVIH
ncbi:MAG: BPL-N domain-containing protein [Bdellovibrionota bacterium]